MSRNFLFLALPAILIGIVCSIVARTAIPGVSAFSIVLAIGLYCNLRDRVTLLEKTLRAESDATATSLNNHIARIDTSMTEINNRLDIANTKDTDAMSAINAIIGNLRAIGKSTMTLRQQVEANRVTLIRHEKKLRGKNNLSLNDRT